MAERARELDGTRLVTNGVNGLLPILDDFAAMIASHRDSAAPSEEEGAGLNDLMANFQDRLAPLMQSDLVGDRTSESFAALDVAGYNYLEARYELDRDLFPNRVIVSTETGAPSIAAAWPRVTSQGNLIGDFTWTGWDYLGESGIGRVRYESDPPDAPGALMAPYPWITSNTGDIDITGFRRPVSHWREIVWGLRGMPYLAVRPPDRSRTPRPGPGAMPSRPGRGPAPRANR
jgi:beta-galactosidase